MSDRQSLVALGAVLGVLALGLLLTFAPGPFKYAKEAIRQCEKSLPRDQHCKVIAVPQEPIHD